MDSLAPHTPATRPADQADGRPPAPEAQAPARPLRRFGPFELEGLVGRSTRTMAWQTRQPSTGHPAVLVMPRAALPAAELAAWESEARRALRVNHPALRAPVELAARDGWPYALYDVDAACLLSNRPQEGPPGRDAAQWVGEIGLGLAFAHEAGAAHRDVQPYLIALPGDGPPQILGFGIVRADADLHDDSEADEALVAGLSGEALELHRARASAQMDVLALGAMLHGALAGRPLLDEPDVGQALRLLPPWGTDSGRLPWETRYPVPEALRAIVNRALDRQPRQRYRSARTLVRALDGWLQADANEANGALAQLSARIEANGIVPTLPGVVSKIESLVRQDRQRTNELAAIVMQDLALTFEMLRAVNSAQVRTTQAEGSGAVVTIRRAIAMLGVDGISRCAAVLRPWPGSLDATQAQALRVVLERVQRAGRLAQALPFGSFDGEVVSLVAVLQNMGRLIGQYHFPDEMQQIRRLVQPGPPTAKGEPQRGMAPDMATLAVMGFNLDEAGLRVVHDWGLDDSLVTVLRRFSPSATVHPPQTDEESLRAIGNCANDAIDALSLPPAEVQQGIARVVQRYARSLGLTLRELQSAIEVSASLRVWTSTATAEEPMVE